jgi:hypothetical protein
MATGQVQGLGLDLNSYWAEITGILASIQVTNKLCKEEQIKWNLHDVPTGITCITNCTKNYGSGSGKPVSIPFKDDLAIALLKEEMKCIRVE